MFKYTIWVINIDFKANSPIKSKQSSPNKHIFSIKQLQPLALIESPSVLHLGPFKTATSPKEKKHKNVKTKILPRL